MTVPPGTWSKKAASEAGRYLDVQPVLPATDAFLGIAGRDQWRLRPDADYVYYCDNETVEGRSTRPLGPQSRR